LNELVAAIVAPFHAPKTDGLARQSGQSDKAKVLVGGSTSAALECATAPDLFEAVVGRQSVTGGSWPRTGVP